MSFGNYPPNYLIFNQRQSKNLAIVLKIEDVPAFFGIADTFTQVRYGDAGIVYGLPGLVYGALRKLGMVKAYMQLDSGLTIQQRIEPESGKGNIGTLNLSFIDYNGEMSQLVTPGIVVDEIMMSKQCTLYIGFAETSFPLDYFIAYRGYITQVVCPPGKVTLQISDCTMKVRQPIFDNTSTILISPVTGSTDSVINVQNTGLFYEPIQGPDGTFDPTVSTYIEVDSEIMAYAATGILNTTQVQVTQRGALGTVATTHSIGATALSTLGVGQNPASGSFPAGINAIDLALKVMLSGWDGPCYTDVGILSFVYDYQGNFVSNEFLLSSDDAIYDLGLSVGDYFYISGSASGNSVSGLITGISTGVNGQNVIIETNQTFTLENPTSAVAAFRSQYDTFPVGAGAMMRTGDVDVPTWQQVRNNFFKSSIFYLRGYYNSAVDAVALIQNDIALPIGCYTISRYGRFSVAVTKPPLPGTTQKFLQLDYTNIIDPDKIQVTRSSNSRSFYNEVSYEFDYDVATQTYSSIQYFFGTNSINAFQQTNVLPITAALVSSALGGATLAQERGEALLNRFQNCTIQIELTVNWSVGSLIEVSDIVNVVDNGTLKIMNFETGQRNLGTQLFEVIDRNYQIISGNVKLKLLGGLGFSITSRFGLYSPSSILNSGCTTTSMRLTPSYGQTLVSSEVLKWTPLIGQGMYVHDPMYSVTGGISLIVGQDPNDITAIMVAPPLPFAPSAGMIMEIAPYRGATTVDPQSKLLYAHFSPSIAVPAGLSTKEFYIAASGVPLMVVGQTVILHDSPWNNISPEVEVLGVTGSLVQVAASLGFIPTTGYLVEGVGFVSDGGGLLSF